jgi:hypothetical protein
MHWPILAEAIVDDPLYEAAAVIGPDNACQAFYLAKNGSPMICGYRRVRVLIAPMLATSAFAASPAEQRGRTFALNKSNARFSQEELLARRRVPGGLAATSEFYLVTLTNRQFNP